MSLQSAREFVAVMRQEEQFRTATRKAAADQQLGPFLIDHDYRFELHHLVMAMAECMDEMAQACPEGG